MVHRDIRKVQALRVWVFILFFFFPLTVQAFTIRGSIQNVQESPDSFQTYVDVEIGTDFAGTLPDDIASITVTGPAGTVLWTKDNLIFSGRIFNMQIPGSPATGLYTFTVTSSPATGSLTATATDAQTVNRSIPFADATKFAPASGTVISTKTPTFSWQQVSYSEATVYYRLEIRDTATNTQLYLSSRKSGISSLTIPANVDGTPILQPGLEYKWRIRTADSGDWIMIMNRSNSDWRTFSTASALQHASPPAINPDNYGVVTYNTADAGINYNTSVIITDLDGIAYDCSSHTVTMTTPASVPYTLSCSSSDSSTTATYTKYIELNGATPESGDFTFTVTDPDGNTASLVDALVVNALPTPDMSSFSLAASSVLADTTPTVTWAAVAGAKDYRFRIYNSDGTKTVWTGTVGNKPSYTVPPGVLSFNTIYRYRIYAYDVQNPHDIDNVSVTPDSATSAIPFTTGSGTDSPYISLGSGVDTYTSMGGARRTRLGIYVLVYDAQGVPGNIRSVRVIFPSGHREILYYDIGNSDNSSIRGAYTTNPDLLPEAGTYTFIAEDRDGHITSASEELTVNPIAYPALTSLRPEMNAVTAGTAVNFAWAAVPQAAYYRLRIYDINFNLILSRNTLENSYPLPAGFLKKDSLYRYDITTYREFPDNGKDNFSVTKWGSLDMPTFMTGSMIGGSSPPAIDLNNYGVYIDHMADPRTGNTLDQLNFYILVADPDGVPANIASVRVTYPDGVAQRDLRLNGVSSSTVAGYSARELGAENIQAGNYTFTVTDFDGNSVQKTDNLVVDHLPCPVNLSPGAGAVVVGTTPTIRWNPVPGASSYFLYINDGWDQQIYGTWLTTNSYTLPSGILQMNATYSYTVYANREQTGENVSNRSVSDYRSITEMTHFSTAATRLRGDVDGNGFVELADAIVALQILSGLTPTAYTDADVNQDGKIGLEEAIHALQWSAGLRF